jgi:mannose-6-phosphate isomerase-like protein (cupin superfamily)
MTVTTALRIDAQDCAPARWDDPARGTLAWRTLISGDVTASDRLVCGIAEMQPGESFALHRHAEPEVYFGLEGEGEVLIDGVAYAMAPGVALYIPSMAEHGVPDVTQPLRWFYSFARDRFGQITYHFTHETPTAGQRPE